MVSSKKTKKKAMLQNLTEECESLRATFNWENGNNREENCKKCEKNAKNCAKKIYEMMW